MDASALRLMAAADQAAEHFRGRVRRSMRPTPETLKTLGMDASQRNEGEAGLVTLIKILSHSATGCTACRSRVRLLWRDRDLRSLIMEAAATGLTTAYCSILSEEDGGRDGTG